MAGTPPSSSPCTRSSTVVLQVLNSQRVVCPSREDLEIETGEYVCQVGDCGRKFQTTSHLQMHVTRHHLGEKLNLHLDDGGGRSKASTDCVYYCPVDGCPRSKTNGNPFPRLGQLKQHYHTIHGKKEYCCQKCGKKFGLRDVCNRHEAECGTTFSCATCGERFRTKNAHYKHAVRKKHELPLGSKPKAKKSSSTVSVLKPPTIIVKNVVQLPKRVSRTAQTSLTALPRPRSVHQTHSTAVQVNLWQPVVGTRVNSSSSASQTTDSFSSIHHYDHDNRQLITSLERSNVSVGTAPLSPLHEATRRDDQFNLEPSDFATQTESYHSQQNFNISNLATQTDNNPYTVGLQQHHTQPLNHFSLCDLATQTNEEEISSRSRLSNDLVERHVFSNPTERSACLISSQDHTSSSATSHQSQAIQTQSQSTNEFGTQTLCHVFQSDFHQFHPSSCTSQETHSNPVRLHHLEEEQHGYNHQHFSGESAVDFGTQTTFQFPLGCSSVNDFGTQTISDQELSDLVHQLSSESLQHILPPECMDFGTQTLESEFAGIECLDFGVQTSFGLQFSSTDHQDQSSQTQD